MIDITHLTHDQKIILKHEIIDHLREIGTFDKIKEEIKQEVKNQKNIRLIEYRKKNRDRINNYHRNYYHANKEVILQKQKLYKRKIIDL